MTLEVLRFIDLETKGEVLAIFFDSNGDMSVNWCIF